MVLGTRLVAILENSNFSLFDTWKQQKTLGNASKVLKMKNRENSIFRTPFWICFFYNPRYQTALLEPFSQFHVRFGPGGELSGLNFGYRDPHEKPRFGTPNLRFRGWWKNCSISLLDWLLRMPSGRSRFNEKLSWESARPFQTIMWYAEVVHNDFRKNYFFHNFVLENNKNCWKCLKSAQNENSWKFDFPHTFLNLFSLQSPLPNCGFGTLLTVPRPLWTWEWAQRAKFWIPLTTWKRRNSLFSHIFQHATF